MIKANELRINNWVMLAGTYWQIGLAEEIDVHSFEPIPLTPEILEKAGFKEFVSKSVEHQTRLFKIKDFSIRTFYGDYDGMPLQLANPSWHYIDIINLHQLQNLYFALTGEELTIEEQNDKRSVARKA